MNQSNYIISASIVVAGAIIAAAVIINGDPVGQTALSSFSNLGATPPESAFDSNSLRLPGNGDHIRGHATAPITIIEFSDFECPFCGQLHPTLKQVINNYEEDVKWIYRHFPLTSIHLYANSAAIASECVARLGGNDAFWQFTDTVFNNQNNLNNDFYSQLALNFNINEDEFNSCLTDKAIKDKVNQDRAEAVATGGRGTPFSVILDKNNNLIPVSGALPYESWQQILDGII